MSPPTITSAECVGSLCLGTSLQQRARVNPSRVWFGMRIRVPQAAASCGVRKARKLNGGFRDTYQRNNSLSIQHPPNGQSPMGSYPKQKKKKKKQQQQP